ncbi:MAG: phytanoyl-CoA dioxygenase family protein [Pseudomonadota bacterium]
MPTLQTLPASSPTERVLEQLTRDGAVILSDALPSAERETLVGELEPFIARTPFGSDDFTGRKTQRTGALVARSPACRPVVMAAPVLAVARRFLSPFAERILLHLTQTIFIHPRQGAQILHRDRLAWGNHIPRSIEPQCNTIWALTDFTAENGATRVVPGSNHWSDDRRAGVEDTCQAEMAAGSVLLYSGSVLHSGGENRSTAPRLGLNITYCLGWLRQEENQYLSCPPHIARTLEPELQELLGYTQGNYALGYYSDPEATEAGRDLLPPEMALGRLPREGQGLSMSEATDTGVSLADVEKKGKLVGADQL